MLKENEGSLGATQPSAVNGGKIDVFCSNGSSFIKKDDDFYAQLLKLEDYSGTDEQYFSGPAQGIINGLNDFIDYVQSSKDDSDDLSDYLSDYVAICKTLEKHFDGNESVMVKKYSTGWKVIFDVECK